MSVPITIGDTAMEEIPGARLIQKRGEASMLTRPFQGDYNELFPWLATLQVGISTDYEFPDMVLDGIEGSEDGAVVNGKLTYYGDPTGYVNPFDPNNLLTKVVWEPRSTILGTTQSSDGSFLVNYFSPTITFKYCTSSIFNSPQFYNSQYVSQPTAITIMDFAFAPGNPNTSTNNYALTGTWVYQVYAICTGFSRDQKGSVYNYLETYAVLLQNPSGSSIPPSQLPTATPIIPSIQS